MFLLTVLTYFTFTVQLLVRLVAFQSVVAIVVYFFI